MADVEMKPEPTAEPMEQQSNGDVDPAFANNEIYQLCVSKKMDSALAKEVVELLDTLGLAKEDFDERAAEMMVTFPVEQAKFIIKELKESKMYGVQNKPQYLMSVMRNLKDRVRQLGAQQALTLPLVPGPPIEKISEIIDRTGYQLEVTVGQRKYHAPPKYTGPDPNASGHEIYIGQIPREIFEDQLIPLFETVGPIFDLRLMMDPIFGRNRGYAFLLYCEKQHASEAAKKYDGHEIQSGKQLKVNVSVANRRLFIGNIPKSKSREEILEELKKHPELEGVTDVIIYSTPDAPENRKNRGFCFVDFSDHKSASDAKRRLQSGKIRPWNGELVVDWAEQQEEPDEETMATVKVLYVKNLKESVTEEQLKDLFGPFGEIDRIKKLRDYAFIHFKERDPAVKAMEGLKGTKIDDVEVDISLAKPQGENKQKKKVMFRGRGQSFGYVPRGGPPRGRGGAFGAGPGSYGGYNPYQGGGGGAGYGYQAAPGYYPPYDPYAAYPSDPYAAQGYGGGYGYGNRGGFGAARGGNFNGRGFKRQNEGRGGPAPKRGGF